MEAEEKEELRKSCSLKENDVLSFEKPGSVFGDMHLLTDKKYRRCYLQAVEDCSCIFIEQTDLSRVIAKMNDSPEYLEKIEFIKKYIPMVSKLSATARDMICRSFERKTFCPGHILLHEGKGSKRAYIIIKGNIELFSNKVPLNSSATSALDLFLGQS